MTFSHSASYPTLLWLTLAAACCAGCGQGAWNNPYPRAQQTENVHYSSFSERPKHLDPARAYSSNEYAFIGQIYEPPLQYHFLKRPYTLEPLTAVAMPAIRYFDAQGRELPEDAAPASIAESHYEIQIQPGILYQPHPAFARDAEGRYLYFPLKPRQLEQVYTLSDFGESGTREMTADDYIYQIKRLADSRNHCPISGLMEEYIVGFGDLGAELDEAYGALAAVSSHKDDIYLDLRDFPLTGVESMDRYRYRIRIKGKYPQFIYWLAMPFFAPMPWEADRFFSQAGMADKNLNLNWYPIGTGPYMLAENNPNLRMVLQRNPNFHHETYPTEGEPSDLDTGLLADAGAALPFIDRAVYTLEKETIPYWNKFLQGYYDASGVSSDSFDQAVRFDSQGEATLTDLMKHKGIALKTAVTTSSYYMGFNMRDDFVGGTDERARKLRQAISIAVDYEEYISIFANGRAVAAQGPLPPGIFGHLSGQAGINPYVYIWNGREARRKDSGAATALLAEAGYENGIDVRTGKPLILYFDTPASGPDARARLNWMRKQFEKLGVQLVVRATDYNRFQEKMSKGTSQIFEWGWNADYPDPENFLFLLYGPNGKVEHGGENAANYDNPEYDRLFERMKNMDNGPERQRVIDRIVDILRRDAPWAWGYHPMSFSLHHSWFENVKPNLLANNTLKYRKVDADLRDRQRAEWNQPTLWPLAVFLILAGLFLVPAFVIYRRRERGTVK